MRIANKLKQIEKYLRQQGGQLSLWIGPDHKGYRVVLETARPEQSRAQADVVSEAEAWSIGEALVALELPEN